MSTENELEKYYKKWEKTLFKYALIVWILLSILFLFIKGKVQVADSVDNHIMINYALSLVLGIASPTVIIVLLYFFLLNKIDKQWWKKKFPQYDIGGEWIDVTNYTYSFSSSGITRDTTQSIPANVKIYQTCRKIVIQPSVSDHFTWYSIAADWDAGGFLNILYKVEYQAAIQGEKYPESRIGYEKVHSCSDKVDNKNRPLEMKGQFWHCVENDGKPVYMGDVIYKRQT